MAVIAADGWRNIRYHSRCQNRLVTRGLSAIRKLRRLLSQYRLIDLFRTRETRPDSESSFLAHANTA
jgi:hypothetical protein